MTRGAQIYVLFQYPMLSQTFVRNEILSLRARGVEVDVISIEDGDHAHIDPGWPGAFRRLARPSLSRALADHGWFIVHAPRRYARYLGAVLALRDHWRLALQRLPSEARALEGEDGPAGCHTHFAWSGASITAYLARLLGVGASITVHANDIYVGSCRTLRARLRRFDRIATVCSYNVEVLREVGIGEAKVDVVPCGVELPERHEPGDEHTSPIDVLSVARLVEKKGVDTLIRAIARVRDRIPEVSTAVVGEGPERERLEALIGSLGVERNVTLAGAMSHDRALEAIDRARVFCLPARRARDGDSDAVPVVIREAMARRVPVISTRMAGIPETVDAAVGWLVDPDSPAELAEAIEAALSDEHTRRRRGCAGRDRVAERWTVDAQAAAMQEMFERRDRRC